MSIGTSNVPSEFTCDPCPSPPPSPAGCPDCARSQEQISTAIALLRMISKYKRHWDQLRLLRAAIDILCVTQTNHGNCDCLK